MTTELTRADDAPEHPESVDSGAAAPADRVPGVAAGLGVLIPGVLGLLAAATLTIERFRLFSDPGYRPSCSINPILSCGSVMTTDQAAFFGFPNPIIGIAAFAVVVVAGVLAVTRTPLPVWFWAGLTAGTGVGLVFVGYLIAQSLYRINALCPYCMVVWAITPFLFVVAAGITARTSGRPRAIWAAGWLRPLLVLVYLGVGTMIFFRFIDYWTSLL